MPACFDFLTSSPNYLKDLKEMKLLQLSAFSLLLTLAMCQVVHAEDSPGAGKPSQEAPAEDLSVAEKELEKYLSGQDSATIAAFDHVNRNWTILFWNGSILKRTQNPTEKPEFSLGRNEDLRTFVINTNPLVFTADRTASAKTDIDSLALLQQLATGLGNVAAVTLANIPSASTPTSVPPPIPADVAVPRTLPALDILVFEYVDALQKSALPSVPLAEIAAAAKAVEGLVAPVKEERLLAWLQGIESKLSAADRPAAPSKVNLQAMTTAFAALATARDRVTATKVPCAGSMAILSEVTMIRRTALVGVGAPERLEAYKRLAVEMVTDLQGQSCSQQLAEATKQLSDWFLANLPKASGPSSFEEKSLGELFASLWPVLDLVKKRSDALTAAKTVLDTQPAVILAVSRLDLFIDRFAAQSNGVDPARGVLEIKRSSFKGKDLKWTKKRTDTVQVVVDASLDGKLTLSHPKAAEGSFTVDRKGSNNLEVDISLVETDLYSPSFEAKDLDNEAGTAMIFESDRSTRSGKLAVMAAYRFPIGAGFALGPQLGVGLDTDDAALFYGISVSWRFLSLGYGETRQKVTALADDRTPGDILQAGQALSTRDEFERESYFSLSITITDLPFFKPKD